MSPRLFVAVCVVVAALVLPAASNAEPVTVQGKDFSMWDTKIGTGKKTCLFKTKAPCRNVKAKWTVEHHGNLKKAKLHGADFREANLTRAKLRATVLTYSDLRDAKLKKAKLGPSQYTATIGRKLRRSQCNPATTDPKAGTECQHADLTGANLTGANLTGATFCKTTMPHSNINNEDC